MGFKNKNIEKFSESTTSNATSSTTSTEEICESEQTLYTVLFFIGGLIGFCIIYLILAEMRTDRFHLIGIVIAGIILGIGGWQYTEYNNCVENNTPSTTST